MKNVSVVWFRNDLRLNANPALFAAAKTGHPILCLYLLEDGTEGLRQYGGASKWWLNKSLEALSNSLKPLNGKLFLKSCGEASVIDAFKELQKQFDMKSVFWNRRYGCPQRNADQNLKSWLFTQSIDAQSFNGSLLREPWEVMTDSGQPYKVFSPFWKSLKASYVRTHPGRLQDCAFVSKQGEKLEDWKLHPQKPDWSGGLEETWTPGEAGANARLEQFLDNALKGYSENRNRPDIPATSMLSPHLAFGEISPQQIYSATLTKMEADPSLEKDGWAFLREIGWRDFSHTLLYQSEDLARENWNTRFDHFPWNPDPLKFAAWQRGQTGYPIVDAGMRELWHTGWMHNRVRMIVASFLVKHLLVHWREGEEWFWDTLVDADPANNPASWQWVAGSGADAAPYFRIFNPITQGEKFDPHGKYVRHWVPELKGLPDKYLNQPWTAPKSLLEHAGIKLGITYPKPLVDHPKARDRALIAYEETKVSGAVK